MKSKQPTVVAFCMDTFSFTTLKPGNKHMLCVAQAWALGYGLTFISEGLS